MTENEQAIASTLLGETSERTVRVVVISGIIDEAMFQHVAMQFARLTAEDPDEPITVLMCSPGGTSVFGWALHDLFASGTAPVLVIGYGIIGSSATIAFLGGQHRILAPNARFLVHPMTREPDPSIHRHEVYANIGENLRNEERHTHGLFAKVTGYPVATIRAWMTKETSFTARQAVTHGLADEVLHQRRRPKAQKRPKKP